MAIKKENAEQLEGVVRVFTAADVPGDRVVGLIRQDWPLMIAEGETTRYIGDVLALVVADSDSNFLLPSRATEIRTISFSRGCNSLSETKP